MLKSAKGQKSTRREKVCNKVFKMQVSDGLHTYYTNVWGKPERSEHGTRQYNTTAISAHRQVPVRCESLRREKLKQPSMNTRVPSNDLTAGDFSFSGR